MFDGYIGRGNFDPSIHPVEVDLETQNDDGQEVSNAQPIQGASQAALVTGSLAAVATGQRRLAMCSINSFLRHQTKRWLKKIRKNKANILCGIAGLLIIAGCVVGHWYYVQARHAANPNSTFVPACGLFGCPIGLEGDEQNGDRRAVILLISGNSTN